jgi:hypothetical protein
VVALVAALCVYFLVLEMFLWTRPLGLKTFGNSPGTPAGSVMLAANQRLHNGFLATGVDLGIGSGRFGLRVSDQNILSALRARGRRLRRRDCQQQDPFSAGRARRHRIDSALVGVAPGQLRLALPNSFLHYRCQRWHRHSRTRPSHNHT